MMNGFTVKGRIESLFPKEDSFGFDSLHTLDGEIEIMAATDGITRDPLIPFTSTLPNMKTVGGRLAFGLGYLPYWIYDPALEAARIATERVLIEAHSLVSVLGHDITPKILERCFSAANAEIEETLNQGRRVDLLKKDYAGCVASAALIHKRRAIYAFIADCGFAVFDSNGNLRLRTPNEGPNSKGSIDDDVALKNLEEYRYLLTFRDPFGRTIIRSAYRNNPDNPLAYGALTGQPKAMSYVRTGEYPLAKGDIVIVFTDGLEGALFPETTMAIKEEELKPAELSSRKAELADILREKDFKGLKQLCKHYVHHEGTLVYRTEE